MQSMNASQIQPHMPVLSSNGEQLGMVDHVDPGNTIKLTKDQKGKHHWIPMSWVTRVDEHVHVDRPGKQAMQQWSSEGPAGSEKASTQA